MGLLIFSGVPDFAQHWAVIHGPGLGHAVPLQLHTEDPGCHGHMESFLFLRQRFHQPMGFGDVSFPGSCQVLHTLMSMSRLRFLTNFSETQPLQKPRGQDDIYLQPQKSKH